MILECYKQPLVQSAIILTKDNLADVRNFCNGKLGFSWIDSKHPGLLKIQLLQDNLTCKYVATEGDFILEDESGEYIAVSPAIFEQNYTYKE